MRRSLILMFTMALSLSFTTCGVIYDSDYEEKSSLTVYYPLKVGNNWTYRHYPSMRTLTQEVIDKQSGWHTIRRTYRGRVDTSYAIVKEGAVVLGAIRSGTIMDSLTLLKEPLEFGTRWQNPQYEYPWLSALIEGYVGLSVADTSVYEETLVVGALTADTTALRAMWIYAPDVGLIRHEIFGRFDTDSWHVIEGWELVTHDVFVTRPLPDDL